ncbi:MAG: glycosyltransferase family 9 protein [Verrucomicrobium sp.]|nr:glycosyltransferase family 9 protein [Verrucomicrobium sp.]
MAKALVFNLSGLGDTLFFLPALAAWKRADPGLRVTALTMFPSVRELLENVDLVDEVIDHDFLAGSKAGGLAFFLGLRRRRFDWGVIPYGSNRLEYNLANFLSGPARRLAHRYRRDPLGSLGFLNQVRAPQRPDRHAVEGNLDLLAAAGLRPAGLSGEWPRAALRIPAAAEAAAARRWAEMEAWRAGRAVVAVHAGSNPLKNQNRRCYPPRRFAEALREIARHRPGAAFLLFEGASDRERTDLLAAALPPELARRAAPESILECAALLDRCAAFIGNDAGLLHLASFRGLPSVALFGPTNPAYVRPWGVPHRVVSLGLPCQPCFEYSAKPLSCPAGIDFACVQDLPPQRVAEAFLDLRPA